MHVLTRLFLDFVEKTAKADKKENMIKTKSRCEVAVLRLEWQRQ